ncbi:D-3-phosphoglycerate dehydrogenase [invertebrate metagenome]|uniref:D-3-phosphoglycerate dehydrogenase n=1 Tax=invertebrate metagenome TaxID=1711999 RepID=A0A484H7W6_9ZZZZ
MPKVLVSDKLSTAALQVFRDRGVEVDMRTGLRKVELQSIISIYDGLAIRSATKVTVELLSAAKNLKVIGRAGIGVDNVDVHAATSRGVIVMNTPFGNAITTAEHTIALMMALARDIPAANISTHASKWEKNLFMGVELYGKTLGIIGCGNIGAVVADRALGLKMKVIAYDPFLSRERANTLGVEKVERDILFARSDFITLHTPLTDATRYFIDAAAFAKMKKGVRIINCARGGLVIEADLLDALQSGTVAGAALDVFEREPATDNPLFGHEMVVCTPHLGASTSEAQEKVAVQVAEQMSDYLTQGTITNALNMPSVLAEDAPRLRPYMKLAEQLGLFAGQLLCTGLTAVRVTFAGAAAHLNTKPLTQVVLQGVLSPTMESVNMVNAPVIARERNITVTESKRETCSDYHTLIQLTVFTEQGTCSVAGTLIHDHRPRLVAVNDIPVEAELGFHMLYVANEDKPGFIGRLGTALGEASINIATFHLGRVATGREAIALIQVDQPIDGALLDSVRALPHVVQAVALRF